MNESIIAGILFLAVGLFILIAALVNWEYFFTRRKAQGFIKLFGRNGARIAYIILGTGILTVGLLSIAGIINLGN